MCRCIVIQPNAAPSNDDTGQFLCTNELSVVTGSGIRNAERRLLGLGVVRPKMTSDVLPSSVDLLPSTAERHKTCRVLCAEPWNAVCGRQCSNSCVTSAACAMTGSFEQLTHLMRRGMVFAIEITHERSVVFRVAVHFDAVVSMCGCFVKRGCISALCPKVCVTPCSRCPAGPIKGSHAKPTRSLMSRGWQLRSQLASGAFMMVCWVIR